MLSARVTGAMLCWLRGGATNTKFRSGAIVLDGLVPRVPGLMGSTPPRGYTTIYENSAGGSFIDCFHRVSWFQNDTDHLMLVKDALWDVSTTLRRSSNFKVSPGRQPEARGSLPMHVPAEAPQKSGLSALSDPANLLQGRPVPKSLYS